MSHHRSMPAFPVCQSVRLTAMRGLCAIVAVAWCTQLVGRRAEAGFSAPRLVSNVTDADASSAMELNDRVLRADRPVQIGRASSDRLQTAGLRLTTSVDGYPTASGQPWLLRGTEGDPVLSRQPGFIETLLAADSPAVDFDVESTLISLMVSAKRVGAVITSGGTSGGWLSLGVHRVVATLRGPTKYQVFAAVLCSLTPPHRHGTQSSLATPTRFLNVVQRRVVHGRGNFKDNVDAAAENLSAQARQDLTRVASPSLIGAWGFFVGVLRSRFSQRRLKKAHITTQVARGRLLLIPQTMKENT